MALLRGDPQDLRPGKFALVIGNSRSGTTAVGSLIDAHPRMICANETGGSRIGWENLSKADVLSEIVNNSEANYAAGRQSEGYRYRIATSPKLISEVDIVGDKVWNPILLLMHGNRWLLHELAERIGCEIRLIHCVRHPFDVIATMHQRSGASLLDRARWYFNHCEAAQALLERAVEPVLTIYHERLLADRRRGLTELYTFLGHDLPEQTLAGADDVLYRQPRTTRDTVDWSAEAVDYVRRRAREFGFLDAYDMIDPTKGA